MKDLTYKVKLEELSTYHLNTQVLEKIMMRRQMMTLRRLKI